MALSSTVLRPGRALASRLLLLWATHPLVAARYQRGRAVPATTQLAAVYRCHTPPPACSPSRFLVRPARCQFTPVRCRDCITVRRWSQASARGASRVSAVAAWHHCIVQPTSALRRRLLLLFRRRRQRSVTVAVNDNEREFIHRVGLVINKSRMR